MDAIDDRILEVKKTMLALQNTVAAAELRAGGLRAEKVTRAKELAAELAVHAMEIVHLVTEVL